MTVDGNSMKKIVVWLENVSNERKFSFALSFDVFCLAKVR